MARHASANVAELFEYFEKRTLNPSMPMECALDALQALANPARLLIFRTLMRHEPSGLFAGVIGEQLGMRHTTLSNHLTVLSRAGLICGAREGRNVRYRACVEGMQALLAFLLKDCCQGHPEECVQLQAAETSQALCDCEAEVPAPPRKRSN
jgi:ArsR family transcriptional regulator